MGRGQVELIETQMISKSREGDGANGLPLVHDPGKWRVPEPLLMEVSLERLIPSPSHNDVRAYGRAFDLKSEVPCLRRVRKPVKADVRRQVRNFHRPISPRVWASSSKPKLNPVRPGGNLEIAFHEIDQRYLPQFSAEQLAEWLQEAMLHVEAACPLETRDGKPAWIADEAPLRAKASDGKSAPSRPSLGEVKMWRIPQSRESVRCSSYLSSALCGKPGPLFRTMR
jgi:hypothetical protein